MIQIIQQTDEEKMAMYMKLPKKKIIEMLIQCNKLLENKMVVINTNCVQSDEEKKSYKLNCDHNPIDTGQWYECSKCRIVL